MVFLFGNSFGQTDTLAHTKGNRDFSDSLLDKYATSVLSIELLENPLDGVKQGLSDKLTNRSLLSNVHGNIGIGFEHGLLTGYIDPNEAGALSVLNTRGNFSGEALGIPVNVSYNYATMKNPLGVNNYFRVAYDAERGKMKAAGNASDNLAAIDSKLDDLAKVKGSLQGKLGMGEVLMQRLKRELKQQEEELRKKQLAEKQRLQSNPADTMAVPDENIDALQSRVTKTKQNLDSIQKLYHSVRSIYDTYSDYQIDLESHKDQLQGLNADGFKQRGNDKLAASKSGFLSNVKTLDMGLTYPQTTAMSRNSVPIQGINLEMEHGNWYTAVSSGVTMNNLMVSTDIVQNKLTNTENLFNQFDFQNIQDQGLLTNIKTGYGKKEGNHVYVGVRHATNSISFIEDGPAIPSVGAELDVRWKPTFMNGTAIDLVYGKTSHNQSVADGTRHNIIRSMFSDDRTNTSLIRLTQPIRRLKTTVQVSSRWIDPYADMRSVGVMQPDNQRHEIRTNTSISKSLKFGLNYRKDQSNVARISDTTIAVDVIGGQINGGFKNGLTYYGSFNHLVQHQNFTIQTNSIRNYMLGLGLAQSYKIKETEHAVTLSYNDFLITDTLSTGLFRNIAVQNSTKLRFGANNFTLAYFSMEDASFDNNNSWIIGDELSIVQKKYRLTFGAKLAMSQQYGKDIGGKIEAAIMLSKNIEWVVTAERLLLGDFYNFFALERFQQFPYFMMTRLNFKL